MKSTDFNVSTALKVISSRFPIGVAIIYKPFINLFIISISLFIFIVSCTPAKNDLSKNTHKIDSEEQNNEFVLSEAKNKTNLINQDILKIKKTSIYSEHKINTNIEIILPQFNNSNITKHLLNSFELSIYHKKISKVSLNINRYYNLNELENLLTDKAKPGKIFLGTLTAEASKVVKNFCGKGILFFSFAPDKNIAENCVYLINFFPEDDLVALFNSFPKDSKVALLYPQNNYGYNINSIIDPIAEKSNSIIINRASYKEDLTDARNAIKELSKYELRKYELERQKKILRFKDDEASKKALKKIIKFETIGEYDFTHLILPDYGIRLLEIAPLLPFYDVDPNKVQFVGTGVWDDKLFFDEPSLQGAIFSGIDEEQRLFFFKDFEKIYQEKPIRIATISYDLLGILNYIINEEMTIKQTYDLLNNSQIKFDGIDGKFFFDNNIIFRELDILKILDGNAYSLN